MKRKWKVIGQISTGLANESGRPKERGTGSRSLDDWRSEMEMDGEEVTKGSKEID